MELIAVGHKEDPEAVFAAPRHIKINLRDVTTRAHVAMPYTIVGRSAVANATTKTPKGPIEVQCFVLGDFHDNLQADILCRMRALDESVTVEEAREALAWAEGLQK